MSKELIEELNEQVLTYDEWAREKCIEKLAACRIEQLEAERVLDEQRVADLMAQVADIAAERDELLALVIRYRKETPLGHQPHMIAHLADEAIAKVRKP